MTAKSVSWAVAVGDCQHEVTALRRFTMVNGTTHYTLQCQNPACLQRPSSQFVGLAKLREALTASEIDAIPAFDHGGRERVNQARRDAAAAWRDSFWDRYSAYMKSEEWKTIRQRIMDRARADGTPMCERCAEVRATDVHHQTYEHVFHELDSELLALCRPCHQDQHPDKDLG
jgi:uncharacterized membrane protein YccC